MVNRSDWFSFVEKETKNRGIIGFRLGLGAVRFLRRTFRQLEGLKVTVKLEVSILDAGTSKRL